MDLCLEGTKTFPLYATGYLVLGKCYEAYGKNREALEQYQQAQQRLPDNTTLQDLVRRVEQQQEQEFRTFLEEQEKRFQQQTAEPEAPAAPGPSGGRETDESTVEYLSKRLQNVKRIQPASEPEQTFAPEEKNLSFVTPTMAEILASQGKYEAAITAYRELLARHPDERHTRRLAELERLHAARQRETDDPENTKAS